jgi:uncharacterized protein (DUF302 family)
MKEYPHEKNILVFLLTVFAASSAAAQGGLVSVKSSHDVVTTANRLESALKEKGITVFARIDHAAGAQRVGQTLKPTLLIIFGSPAMGTPLIQRSRSIGIDLPLKASDLGGQRRSGLVHLQRTGVYGHRHGITEMGEAIQKWSRPVQFRHGGDPASVPDEAANRTVPGPSRDTGGFSLRIPGRSAVSSFLNRRMLRCIRKDRLPVFCPLPHAPLC